MSPFEEQMLKAKKEGADVVIICFPEVLGDDFETVMERLEVLSKHGLQLAIVPPEERSVAMRRN